MRNLLILLMFSAPVTLADLIVEPEYLIVEPEHLIVEPEHLIVKHEGMSAQQDFTQAEPDFSWLSLLAKTKAPQAELQSQGGPNWFVPMDLPPPKLAGEGRFLLPEPGTLLLFGAGLLLLLMARTLRRSRGSSRNNTGPARD